jgi:hypothetical protein
MWLSMLSAFQQSEKGMIETTKLLNEMRAERASAHSPAMLDSEESETPASEEANTLACMAGGP